MSNFSSAGARTRRTSTWLEEVRMSSPYAFDMPSGVSTIFATYGATGINCSLKRSMRHRRLGPTLTWPLSWIADGWRMLDDIIAEE